MRLPARTERIFIISVLGISAAFHHCALRSNYIMEAHYSLRSLLPRGLCNTVRAFWWQARRKNVTAPLKTGHQRAQAGWKCELRHAQGGCCPVATRQKKLLCRNERPLGQETR